MEELMRTTRYTRVGVGLVAAVTLAATTFTGTASAHDGASSNDGAIDNAKITHEHDQHGGTGGHLPAGHANVDLVSKLRLKNVEPDKIADVGVFNGYAYLAAWGGTTCKYNGIHVVDIHNLAAPTEVAFIQAKEGSFPGEGVQALHVTTPFFNGDLLVTNNEICKDKAGFGGMNIYDVTNPAHPTPLAEGVGDETVTGQGKKAANEIHSVFAWDAGDKAYAVIVDDEEGLDVDIMDITDPKKATLIAEYDIDEMFPQVVQPAPLTEIFFHDVVVKQMGDRQVMLLSYWTPAMSRSTSRTRRTSRTWVTPTSPTPTLRRWRAGSWRRRRVTATRRSSPSTTPTSSARMRTSDPSPSPAATSPTAPPSMPARAATPGSSRRARSSKAVPCSSAGPASAMRRYRPETRTPSTSRWSSAASAPSPRRSPTSSRPADTTRCSSLTASAPTPATRPAG